jgi:hypothetical protein
LQATEPCAGGILQALAHFGSLPAACLPDWVPLVHDTQAGMLQAERRTAPTLQPSPRVSPLAPPIAAAHAALAAAAAWQGEGGSAWPGGGGGGGAPRGGEGGASAIAAAAAAAAASGVWLDRLHVEAAADGWTVSCHVRHVNVRAGLC